MIALTTQNLRSHKLNVWKSIVQNFKTVVQSQVELQSYKVEKLDASIRPFFANPVTYAQTFSETVDSTHKHFTNFVVILLYSMCNT